MNFKVKHKKIILVTLGILLIVWSIFVFSIDIEMLTQTIGLQNVYLILFLVAVVAGTSFLTSASFYAIFLSYVGAGLDPLVLGIVGGVGMAIGDSLYFLFFSKTGDVLKAGRYAFYEKIYTYVSHLPRAGVYVFTYLYASFAPIPNDILMIVLGVLKFPYRYVLPIIVLGNITLLTLIAYGINVTIF